MRAKTAARSRIRFDVPESYIRAIRVRAAQEAVYPRDVLIRALDRYLAGDGKSLATTESFRAAAPTPPAQ